MNKKVKKIQDYKVVLKFHNASHFQKIYISSHVFRRIADIDLSSENCIMKQLLYLDFNVDYSICKKSAKLIIDIYCK